MSTTEHRTLRIVREHLVPPEAPLPSSPLARAVRAETGCGALARQLADCVGGLDQLEHLDATPHGDEPFDWSALGDADAAFVGEVVSLVDGFCDALLDVEYRTILRRFLALVLRNDPAPIRRSSRPPRVAAALAHAALEASGLIGRGYYRMRRGGGLRAGDVAAWFGTSSVSDPAHTLARATGLGRDRLADDPWELPRSIALPSPALLHSILRRVLVQQRDILVEQFLDDERKRAGRRPMVNLGDGRVELRSCAADVAFVHKGTTKSGQLFIVLALAPLMPEPELELYGLTVPEAHRLLQLLQSALDEPARLVWPRHDGP